MLSLSLTLYRSLQYAQHMGELLMIYERMRHLDAIAVICYSPAIPGSGPWNFGLGVLIFIVAGIIASLLGSVIIFPRSATEMVGSLRGVAGGHSLMMPARFFSVCNVTCHSLSGRLPRQR